MVADPTAINNCKNGESPPDKCTQNAQVRPIRAHGTVASSITLRTVARKIMINYKRIVCDIVIFATVAAIVIAAPTSDPNCLKDVETHYDQRQNGTENYRLNIDGVVFAVAPAESLVAAVSDIDFSELLDLEELNDTQKPLSSSPVAGGSSTEKPSSTAGNDADSAVPKEKSAHHGKKKGYKVRLANILMPLLRKHHRQHQN